MIFEIKQKTLSKLISISNKAINSFFVIPILSGILFRITKEKITLISSNNTLSIKVSESDTNKFKIYKETDFILPAKYILDLVKKINEQWISFKFLDNNSIKITTSNSEIKLKTLNVLDYPNINFKDNYNNFITLDSYEVGNSIKQTIYCTSISENSTILNGINFDVNSEKSILTLTGSDSFRISKKVIDIDDNKKIDSMNFTLPYKTVNELFKICSELKQQDIKFFFNENKVLFEFENFLIQSNTLEEQYPNTENVIPKNYKIKISSNRNDLLRALDRALLFSKELNNNMINFEINNEDLIIVSASQEIGFSKEKITIKNHTNEISNLKISFNGKFLMESIKNLKSDTIYLFFNNNLSQFEVSSREEDNLKQLIVPLKTHNI